MRPFPTLLAALLISFALALISARPADASVHRGLSTRRHGNPRSRDRAAVSEEETRRVLQVRNGGVLNARGASQTHKNRAMEKRRRHKRYLSGDGEDAGLLRREIVAIVVEPDIPQETDIKVKREHLSQPRGSSGKETSTGVGDAGGVFATPQGSSNVSSSNVSSSNVSSSNVSSSDMSSGMSSNISSPGMSSGSGSAPQQGQTCNVQASNAATAQWAVFLAQGFTQCAGAAESALGVKPQGGLRSKGSSRSQGGSKSQDTKGSNKAKDGSSKGVALQSGSSSKMSQSKSSLSNVFMCYRVGFLDNQIGEFGGELSVFEVSRASSSSSSLLSFTPQIAFSQQGTKTAAAALKPSTSCNVRATIPGEAAQDFSDMANPQFDMLFSDGQTRMTLMGSYHFNLMADMSGAVSSGSTSAANGTTSSGQSAFGLDALLPSSAMMLGANFGKGQSSQGRASAMCGMSGSPKLAILTDSTSLKAVPSSRFGLFDNGATAVSTTKEEIIIVDTSCKVQTVSTGTATTTSSATMTSSTISSSTTISNTGSGSSTTVAQGAAVTGVGVSIEASSTIGRPAQSSLASSIVASATATTSVSLSSVTATATATATASSSSAFPASSSSSANAGGSKVTGVGASALGFSSLPLASATSAVRSAASAQSAATVVAAAASASATAFQVPGRSLSVLPIGLGVFAGVSVIALIVVGVVTWERRKYRRQFRARKLAEQGAQLGYGGAGMR